MARNKHNLGKSDDMIWLSELGLSKYEAQIYLTLITEGVSTAKDISSITGIPYGKIYEIVDSLVIKGFANVLPSKPMKCQAVSPRFAVEHAKKTMENKLSLLEKHVIEQLEPRFQSRRKSTDTKSLFLLIHGRANVHRMVEKIVRKSQRTINIMTTENGLKRLVAHKEVLSDAFTRGVVINIAAPLTKENQEDCAHLSFCNLKHVSEVSSVMYSFDSTESIIIEITPDDENYMTGRDFGVYSQSISFSSFIDMFYHTFFKSDSPMQKSPLEITKCALQAGLKV